MAITIHRNDPIAHGGRAQHLVLGTFALLPSLSWAELTIEPRIAVGTTYVDNIELSPDGVPKEEEYVGQIYPGLYLLSQGTRHRVEVDYTLQALFYAEDSDRDQTDHQLAAQAEVTLVDNLFFVEADATYTQQLIDPTRPVPTSNLFEAGNLADATAGTITPILRRDFGQTRAEARYTYGRVDYSGRDTDGSELEGTRNEEINASVASRSEDAPLIWRVEYDSQEADYDNALPFEYESAEAELGWRVLRAVRLVAIGGVESDLIDDPEPGGLDESYWLAGFRWRQDPVGELEMLAGERFFGDAYRFRWERRARVLRMRVSYEEEPTTAAQDLALSPVEIERGVVYEPSDDYTTITSEPFINKAFEASIALVGRRTEIELTGFSYRRDYVVTAEEENIVGGGITITRRTGARSEISLRGEYRDSEIRGDPAFSDFWGRLGWELRIQPSLVFSAMLGHQERSEVTGYEANWATLSLEKTF